jgi:hypothetical protein
MRKKYKMFVKETRKKWESILGLDKRVILKRKLNRPGMHVLVAYAHNRIQCQDVLRPVMISAVPKTPY